MAIQVILSHFYVEIPEDCLDEDRYNITSKIQQDYHDQVEHISE